jgi:hypothetical protein
MFTLSLSPVAVCVCVCRLSLELSSLRAQTARHLFLVVFDLIVLVLCCVWFLVGCPLITFGVLSTPLCLVRSRS